MSTSKCLLFAIYSLYGIVNGQCKWTVNTPGGVNTFDLTCAEGKELITSDLYYGGSYLFSLCDNGEMCNAKPAMVTRTLLDVCYILGRWDESIQPVYEAANGGRWIFTYANGADDYHCGNPAVWNPTFQCDASTEWAIGQVQISPGNCSYSVTIRTKYACTGNTECANSTTTTTSPQEECIWNVGDNTLNLTVIEGLSLYGISGEDAQQIYVVSPCSNNVKCDGGVSMITIGTMSDCMQMIARWDGGLTRPQYSDNYGGQWEFVYTNGDGCSNGPESVVTVFWNCNPYVGYGRISVAREIGPCVFEIQIDSNLACS